MTATWFRPSDLPAEWQSVPIRRIGQVLNGGTPTSEPENWGGEIPFVTPPDLNGADGAVLKSTGRTLSKTGVKGAGIAPAGSVLVSTRAPIGHVGRVAEKSAFNQGCRAVSFREGAESRYFAAALVAARADLVARGQGTTFLELSSSEFASILVPFPPLDEQRAIADYLDQETAQIDALVAKQEEFIELLRERRSAEITSAVTGHTRLTASGGYEVFRPLVDSGNEYLGAVPPDWDISRLGRHMVVNGGQVDPRVEPWANMVLVAPNHIESGTGRIVGRESARDQGADSGKYLARRGQILYSKIRPALNKVAIANEDCLCSADMYAMSSLNERDVAEYLAYFMLSKPFHAFVTQMSMRVKMPKVNREELSSAPWLRPPAAEQRRIARYLDEHTSRLDALIAKAKEHIALAKERRSALITAAVTGQLDVRTARKAG